MTAPRTVWPESVFDGKENWSWLWWDGEDGDALASLVHLLRGADLVSFDTETSGLDMTADRVVALSFAYTCPTTGDEVAWTVMCDDSTDWTGPVMAPLVEWLEDAEAGKVLANAKFDMNILAFHDVTLRGVRYDTMLLSQLCDSHEQYHNVDVMTERHLGLRKIPTETLIGKGKKFTGWGPVPRSVMAEYANEDVIAVLRLVPKMLERVEALCMQDTVALEMELLPVVSKMEQAGMKIDVDRMREIHETFGVRAEQAREAALEAAAPARDELARKKTAFYEKCDRLWLEAKAKDKAENGGAGKAPVKLSAIRNKAKTAMRSAQDPLNLNSGAQIAELIYGQWELHRKLGLRHPPKTAKGGVSTDKDAMEKLAPYSAFCQRVLDHRVVSKLCSTYTGVLPDLVKPRTGRVHASYWQCGTVTGRFSCSDPNLQNIPNHSNPEEGRMLRHCFVPEPGYVILAPDYSQVELRVTAHLSGQREWIDAFINGEDIHQATADLIGVSRAVAKTVNFASLYGAGAQKIAATAGISYEKAVAVLEAYWAGLEQVRAFLDAQIAHARKYGWVQTLYGRRRPIRNINHRWGGKRKGAENQAGNTPVQGTAADIMKMAMVAVDRDCLTPDWDARMIATVHDELLVEVRREQAEELGGMIQTTMQSVVTLDVPLVVDLTQGNDWAEAH